VVRVQEFLDDGEDVLGVNRNLSFFLRRSGFHKINIFRKRGMAGQQNAYP
jgi:hypothetical protein